MAALLDDDLADAEDIVGPAASNEHTLSRSDELEKSKSFVLASEQARLQLRENRKKIKEMVKSFSEDSSYSAPKESSSTLKQIQAPALPEHLVSKVSSSYSGWVVKQGGGSTVLSRRNWLRRWFVLDERGLRYCKDDVSPALGEIKFHHMLGIGHSGAPMGHGFYVETEKRVYFMSADSRDDCLLWIACLRRAKLLNKNGASTLLF